LKSLLHGVSKGVLLTALFFLLIVSPVNAGQQVSVDGNLVNVRSGPGLQYERVAQVNQGDKYDVLETRDGWVKIDLGTSSGWVAGWLVHTVQSSKANSQQTSKAAANAVRIYIDGEQAEADVSPYIDSNNRTMVPLRFIAEKLGAYVSWDGSQGMISVSQPGSSIQLWVGKKTASYNGEEFDLDTSPVIKEERTMVPLRFVSERLGCETAWNKDQRSVYITRKVNVEPEFEVTVSSQKANIRSGPGTNYTSVAQVDAGNVLGVLGDSGEWYEVLLPQGGKGWISKGVVYSPGEEPDFNGEPGDDSSRGNTGDRYCIVTGSTVNVRSGPGLDYGVVDQVARGTRLQIGESNSGWYQIALPSGKDGWIAGWLVSVEGEQGTDDYGDIPDPAVVTRTAIIVADVANVRQQASEQAQLVTQVYRGQEVPVTDQQGQWYKLSLSGGVEGWIANWLVATKEQPASQRDGKLPSRGEDPAKPLEGTIIVLDPGHGSMQPGDWSDPGAVGVSGLRERDVVVNIGETVGQILTAKGATVVHTRTGDTVMSLEERAGIASATGAEIYVSIHCNSSLSSLLAGTSTYYYAPANMSASMRASRERLAAVIQEELLRALGRENKGIRQEAFSVLRNTTVPSVLVEVAFLSNAEEERLLSTGEFQTKAASAIANGIIRYFSS